MVRNIVQISKSRISPRWGQERRLEFIDFRLLWDRVVNRSELIDFFGISPQQASTDLTCYQELAPGNVHYDKSRKRYEITAEFQPVFAKKEASDYLRRLLEQQGDGTPSSINFIGWTPPVDVVASPARSVASETLTELLWVIRHGIDVEITYQSMRKLGPEKRWIAPHAFGFDGTRWHVRAWCYKTGAFADFVLSRIQQVHARRPSTSSADADIWWHETVELLIRARKELSPAQQKAIAQDYGMTNGTLALRSRKAMAFYLLRSLRLDQITLASAIEQPLELINRDALADILAAGRKFLGVTEST